MVNRLSFLKIIFAIILTIFFSVTMFISVFTIPTEIIFLNEEKTDQILADTVSIDDKVSIITEVITNELFLSQQISIPDYFNNKDTIKFITEDYLPRNWAEEQFDLFIGQGMSIINLKTTIPEMRFDLSAFKESMVTESGAIAYDFIQSLPNCTTEEINRIENSKILKISDLPSCEPNTENLDKVQEVVHMAFENLLKSLPSEVKIQNIKSINVDSFGRLLLVYSFARWIFRLMPLLTICIFIGLAMLLRSSKLIMRRWCGMLLFVQSVFMVILVVISIVGLRQIISIALNELIPLFIPGIGKILSHLLYAAGLETLIWVIATLFFLAVFGTILFLSGRKKKKNEDVLDHKKEILPKTLEEIEEEEQISEKE